MIKDRKSLAVENLVRTLFTVIALVAVAFIIKPYAAEAFNSLFEGNLEQTFNSLVQEINNLNVKSKLVFINLDPNTAIVGFSSNAKEFRCFGCGSDTKDMTSYFVKPDDDACKNSACACLCPKGLVLHDLRGNPPFEMKCDKPICKPLKKDLFDVIEHKENKEQQGQTGYSKLKNTKWTGGFLYDRNSRGDFISNGLPQMQSGRFTVVVTQDNTEKGTYIAVCPNNECTYSLQTQTTAGQGVELPSNICQIMYDCFKKENTGYQKNIQIFPDDFGQLENYCKYNRPITRQYTKEDCEKVQACVKSKGISSQSKCEDKGGFFQLSFLP